jgi:hypothetical protein
MVQYPDACPDAITKLVTEHTITTFNEVLTVEGRRKCVCGKEGTKMCGGCGSLRYCSKECQRGHWERHKEWCLRMRQSNGKLATLL